MVTGQSEGKKSKKYVIHVSIIPQRDHLLQMKPNISLSDQCIKSDGLAQVKVEVKKVNGISRINIIDVLKLADEDCDEDDEDLQEKEGDDVLVEDLSVKTDEDFQAMSPLSGNNSEAAHWTIFDASSLLSSTVPAGEN